ncbi:hypothetical protein GGS23DRAFT_598235 [Durotheca rogersii]|uniref:uncharacterized protein n=1 Tax=Durotheca rogersii TaxID=419775 RepID=UPI00221EE130|nr:uncharacterized protein GGS23DRAFT_598235 [Durotheca rogersii]KAI5861837.1 hypothetical protein GGS23DRAFT_598235 [Durotheca rogersii]
MSSSPTERFRELALESMPPITRLQSRRHEQQQQEQHPHQYQQAQALAQEQEQLQGQLIKSEEEEEMEDSSVSFSESDAEPEFDIDEDGIMVSPSGLRYSLDLLDEQARDNVARAVEVPSQLALRGCQPGDERCLFLITEPVEYTVRTGTAQSGYGVPSCTCEGDDGDERPCRHILWLFDRIAAQVLGEHQPQLLPLSPHGHAAALGENPYDAIAAFHLDMLADCLHCGIVGSPTPDDGGDDNRYDNNDDSDDDAVRRDGPSPRRVQETRELLATLSDVPAEAYRPDLFEDNNDNNHQRLYRGAHQDRRDWDRNRRGGAGRGRVVRRGDLEQTVARMLLRNDDVFESFLTAVKADERRRGAGQVLRFRSLLRRAEAALAGLGQHARRGRSVRQGGVWGSDSTKPKDVAWCASHLTAVARQLYAAIHTTARPLKAAELREAARAAVRVLQRVVLDFAADLDDADDADADARADRGELPNGEGEAPAAPRESANLYWHLVGARDGNFVVDVLASIPPEVLAPWIEDLAAVEARVAALGAPASYRARLRALVEHLRSRRAAATAAAEAGGAERGSGRVGKED